MLSTISFGEARPSDALKLGLSEAATLGETLEKEKATDETLTEIAESIVNQEAQTEDAE
jgi:ferritin-like metal-binding protein YciE